MEILKFTFIFYGSLLLNLLEKVNSTLEAILKFLLVMKI